MNYMNRGYKKLLLTSLGLLGALSFTVGQSMAGAELSLAHPLTDKEMDESVKTLCDYLKVDTTNPPGNETAGAQFLAKILHENGIKAEVFETAPNRSCVYARLTGNGKKGALVLLSHIDVVPAKASDWKHPPFAGEIHDGEIWGRGALDMKGQGIIELASLLAIKRSGVVLDRDIIFLATPDEEIGGTYGAKWFAEHKADLVKGAEYLINEGFSIDAKSNGEMKYWGVDVAEKSILWLSLKTKGLAGHASMPQIDSVNNRLVIALAKIAKNPPPMTVLPAVKEYFTAIAPREESPEKELYARIEEVIKEGGHDAELRKDKLKSSMLANTCSITVLKAGYKTNVIPAEAEAELDCRLLPGVDKQEFVDFIRKTIDDDSIEIKVLEWEKAEPSDHKSNFFKAVRKAAEYEKTTAPVVPMVVPWFTDSHWFRELGIKAYGFEPIEVDAEHLATMHGKDERIPVAGFKRAIERLTRVIYYLSQESN